MMSNVIAQEDRKENVYPRKEREQSKIDGPVGAIMALNLFIAESTAEKESIYESRGISII